MDHEEVLQLVSLVNLLYVLEVYPSQGTIAKKREKSQQILLKKVSQRKSYLRNQKIMKIESRRIRKRNNFGQGKSLSIRRQKLTDKDINQSASITLSKIGAPSVIIFRTDCIDQKMKICLEAVYHVLDRKLRQHRLSNKQRIKVRFLERNTGKQLFVIPRKISPNRNNGNRLVYLKKDMQMLRFISQI